MNLEQMQQQNAEQQERLAKSIEADKRVKAAEAEVQVRKNRVAEARRLAKGADLAREQNALTDAEDLLAEARLDAEEARAELKVDEPPPLHVLNQLAGHCGNGAAPASEQATIAEQLPLPTLNRLAGLAEPPPVESNA